MSKGSVLKHSSDQNSPMLHLCSRMCQCLWFVLVVYETSANPQPRISGHCSCPSGQEVRVKVQVRICDDQKVTRGTGYSSIERPRLSPVSIVSDQGHSGV